MSQTLLFLSPVFILIILIIIKKTASEKFLNTLQHIFIFSLCGVIAYYALKSAQSIGGTHIFSLSGWDAIVLGFQMLLGPWIAILYWKAIRYPHIGPIASITSEEISSWMRALLIFAYITAAFILLGIIYSLYLLNLITHIT